MILNAGQLRVDQTRSFPAITFAYGEHTMRLARKLSPLIVVAIMATTFMATGTATAQEEPVEVENEDTLQHCTYSEADCDHHLTGSSVLVLHQFGSESVVSQCNDELVARLGKNGSGYIHQYTNNASPQGPCTVVMCNGAGEPVAENEWAVSGMGEFTGPQQDEGHVTVRFCFDPYPDPNVVGTHCTAELTIQNHGNHHYGWEAVSEECPIFRMLVWLELSGSWESEALPAQDEEDIGVIH